MQNIVLLLVFAAVTFLSWVIINSYSTFIISSWEGSRLDRLSIKRDKNPIAQIKPLLRKIADISKRMKFTRKWMDSKNEKYRKLLVKAGFPGNIDSEEFMALKELGSITLFFIFLILVGLTHPAIYVIFVGFSFFLPDMWLKDLAKARQSAITRSLPEALDTLALVVGAGVDLGGAIDVFIDGNKGSMLAEEFLRVRNEIKLGKPRAEALEGMAARSDCDPLTNFTTSVIQSERMGTSLSDVLNSQSQMMRAKRFHLAEELGQKAPVKMLAPLLLLIMPNVFIVLFAPMILKMIYK